MSGVAVATAYAAFKGLTIWRTEIRGKAVFKTASRAMFRLNRLERSLAELRYPAIGEAEAIHSATVLKEEGYDITKIDKQVRVWQIRMREVKKNVDRYRVLSDQLNALDVGETDFGPAIVNETYEVTDWIQRWSRAHFDDTERKSWDKMTSEKQHKARETVYAFSNQSDEVSQRIATAFKEERTRLRELLR